LYLDSGGLLTLRRSARILAPLALAVVLANACREDPLTFESLAGEYSLLKVDGEEPPVVVSDTGAGTKEITGGRLTMFDYGDYLMTIDYRTTLPGVGDPVSTDSTFIETGPYSIQGDVLILATTIKGMTLAATVSGSLITIGLPSDGAPIILSFGK
jgi:hypothetical protein